MCFNFYITISIILNFVLKLRKGCIVPPLATNSSFGSVFFVVVGGLGIGTYHMGIYSEHNRILLFSVQKFDPIVPPRFRSSIIFGSVCHQKNYSPFIVILVGPDFTTRPFDDHQHRGADKIKPRLQ